MPPFIYINGYPGVGKLTVAKELSKLLSKAKIISNHLLIDTAAAVFERSAEEYLPLRQVLRKEVLAAIANAKSTRDITWIFTDQRPSDATGSSSAKDYRNAADVRGAPFFSIILECELNENLKRVTGLDRSKGSNTKLTDPEILRGIRETEDIFLFGDDNELVLDTTNLTPSEAAARICDHISRVL